MINNMDPDRYQLKQQPSDQQEKRKREWKKRVGKKNKQVSKKKQHPQHQLQLVFLLQMNPNPENQLNQVANNQVVKKICLA